MFDQSKTLHEFWLELGTILATDSELRNAEVFLPDPRESDSRAVIPVTAIEVEERSFCEVREGGIRRSIGGKAIYIRTESRIDPLGQS